MRAVVLGLLLAGCGADAASGDGPPVDSTLVDLLADLHLADARAALAPDSLQAAVADSLEALVLAEHDTEADRLGDHLDALSRDPGLATVHYDAVEEQLADERQGIPMP